MNDRAKYEELYQLLQSSEELKNRFIKEPKSVLADMGIEVSNSMSIKVHEDTTKIKHFIIPLNSEMEDETKASNPLLRKAISKINTDESFKNELLNNPKSSLFKLTGEKFPEDLSIRVYENTPTVKHLVVFFDSVNQELSEKELESIAGGQSLSLSPFPLPVVGLRATPW